MSYYIVNSHLIQDTKEGLSPTDRGLTLGDGLFDTLLLRNGRAIDFKAHALRLQASLKSLYFPSFSQDQWQIDIQHIWQAYAKPDLAAIRTTLTRGSGQRGIRVPKIPETNMRVFITLSPLETLSQAPLSLCVSPIRRNETSPTAHHKTLCYLDACIGQEQARSLGADDALYLNTQGQLTCSSVASLFFISENGIHTPPLTDGCLPGTRRQWILQTAQALQIPCHTETIWPEDLFIPASRFKAGFACNSLSLLRPITTIHTAQYQWIGLTDKRLTQNHIFQKLFQALQQHIF